MDVKDYLILGFLGLLGLGASGVVLASKANYYELKTRQLEAEIIELRAEYEGYTKAANQLKP